jgi:flagellar hook-associated protein 2
LLGNSDISSLKSDLAAAVGNSVSGVNPSLNRISTIGLSFDTNGKLRFDSSKLSAALNGQVTGVSSADVKNLFALSGTSTNSGVTFLLGGAKTRPSPVAPTAQPYRVNVSSAASQGSILASLALPASVVLTSSNNTFNFKLNALTTATITLDPGTYDPAALAAAIQQQLSGRYAANSVSVDLDANRLRFTSAIYGSSSQVALAGGSAISTLGFQGTETGVGTNVVGSFTAGGKTESAVGSGQVLAGLGDNANTAGLQVRVALSAAQVPSGGTSADLTVTQGLASRLSQTLDKYTDSISGRFKTIDDRFSQSTATIESTISRQNSQLTEKKNALVQQFADLETSVSSLKNIGNTITASFGVLSYK